MRRLNHFLHYSLTFLILHTRICARAKRRVSQHTSERKERNDVTMTKCEKERTRTQRWSLLIGNEGETHRLQLKKTLREVSYGVRKIAPLSNGNVIPVLAAFQRVHSLSHFRVCWKWSRISKHSICFICKMPPIWHTIRGI